MKKIITAIAAIMVTLTVSAQTKVSDAKVWNFNNRTNNEVIATETIEDNGLYIRGGADAHKIVAKRSGCTLELKDGSVFKAKMSAAQPGSKFMRNVKASTKADAVKSGTDDCYAFETTVPGRVVVIAMAKKGQTDKPGRCAAIYFNGKEVARHDFKSEGAFELSFDAKEAGTFFIGANGGYFLYEIRFTPGK